MIILSAFSFIPHLPCNCQLSIVNCQLHKSVEIRFTFCFRFQYVKDHFGPESGSGNPRAWTSVPGRFPSFLYILFTETRELQHLRKHSFANLAVPLTCVVLNLQYSASLRSPFPISSERRCSLICLACAELRQLTPSPERRCSSRTFRYGYLVTT